jgi:hypothetical protein
MPDYVVDSTRQYDEKGKLYYEVHQYPKSACANPDYPRMDNQRRIGTLKSDAEALARAEAMGYKKAVGCAFCCKDPHKK